MTWPTLQCSSRTISALENIGHPDYKSVPRTSTPTQSQETSLEECCRAVEDDVFFDGKSEIHNEDFCCDDLANSSDAEELEEEDTNDIAQRKSMVYLKQLLMLFSMCSWKGCGKCLEGHQHCPKVVLGWDGLSQLHLAFTKSNHCYGCFVCDREWVQSFPRYVTPFVWKPCQRGSMITSRNPTSFRRAIMPRLSTMRVSWVLWVRSPSLSQGMHGTTQVKMHRLELTLCLTQNRRWSWLRKLCEWQRWKTATGSR